MNDNAQKVPPESPTRSRKYRRTRAPLAWEARLLNDLRDNLRQLKRSADYYAQSGATPWWGDGDYSSHGYDSPTFGATITVRITPTSPPGTPESNDASGRTPPREGGRK